MRTLMVGLALALASAGQARAATSDADQARRSYAVANVELQASQVLLDGLGSLARADATWDHEHPRKLFDDARRSVLTATDSIGELRTLAQGQLASAALDRAQQELDRAHSDLRALAAPAMGLALPANERARAVERLRTSLHAAQQDLSEAGAQLGVAVR